MGGSDCLDEEVNSKSEDGQQLTFKAKYPHFYKIIRNDDALLEGKLGIPRKLVKEYGNELSGSIILEVPSGAEWQVELIRCKCNDKICFGKGWKEFVEHYGIAPGHMLVFKHERSDGFRVIIFDMSATEIDYPCSLIDNAGKDISVEKNFGKPKIELPKEDDDAIEFWDESSQKWIKEATLPPTECLRPQKKVRTYFTRRNKLESTSKLHTLFPSITLQHRGDIPKNSARNVNPYHSGPAHQTKEKGDVIHVVASEKCGVMGFVARAKPLTEDERQAVLKKASAAFKSNNPFFVVVMHPSYVLSGLVSIPKSFVKKYLKKQHGDAILCGLDGRSWNTKFSINRGGARIFCGWKDFAKDNCLVVGDVCVFEMIDSTKIKFKVVIFKVTEDQNCSSQFLLGNTQ